MRPSLRRFLWLCVFVLGLAGHAAAQIEIDLTLTRRTYLLYEPLVATITLTNLAGRDVTFSDERGKQWFNVEVTTQDGQVIQPYDRDYRLHPLTVPAGQTVKRKIDLNPLFPIRGMGSHHLRANIYLADADRFFASRYVTFDIAEGQLIWRQDIGVPGNTFDTREVSLMTFQRPDRLELYARVRETESGTVFASTPLGRLIMNGMLPQALFDRRNTLHVLQEAAPSAYLYTELTTEGEEVSMSQQAYLKRGTNRPTLSRTANGDVEVRGGQLQPKELPNVATAPLREPKLSDRPAVLPGQTPGKKTGGQ